MAEGARVRLESAAKQYALALVAEQGESNTAIRGDLGALVPQFSREEMLECLRRGEDVPDPAVEAAIEAVLEDVPDPEVPKDLNRPFRWKARAAGAAAGAVMGAKAGSLFGIATAGWGMPATIPCMILGGVLGFCAGDQIARKVDEKAGPPKPPGQGAPRLEAASAAGRPELPPTVPGPPADPRPSA